MFQVDFRVDFFLFLDQVSSNLQIVKKTGMSIQHEIPGITRYQNQFYCLQQFINFVSSFWFFFIALINVEMVGISQLVLIGNCSKLSVCENMNVVQLLSDRLANFKGFWIFINCRRERVQREFSVEIRF